MRRRLLIALTATLVALGGVGIGSAHADTSPEPTTPASTTSEGRYWACVSLNTVHVGMCLENPLPDPSILPSPRQTIYDVTGVSI